MNRAFLAALLLLNGCALVPSGAPPTAAPGGEPSVMRDALLDFRATLHCHCHLSHDSEGTIEEIAAAAKKQGLNAVLLTDHYEPGNVGKSANGLVDGVLFVPGLEEGLAESEGSVLATGLVDEIEKDPRPGLPARAVEQGAFVAAGHVERIPDDHDLSVFHGFEVYNLHAEFEGASKLGLLARLFVQTRDTFLERTVSTPTGNLARLDHELAKGHELTLVSGHDAHNNIQALGITFGTYEELFRLFSTHILAEELTRDSLVDALKRGRTYVSFDLHGDGTGFSARCKAGDTEAIVGETLRWAPGSRIEVRLPRSADVHVLRDGKPWLKRAGRYVSEQLPGGGIYRVEVYRRGKLWILGSPIYVKDAS